MKPRSKEKKILLTVALSSLSLVLCVMIALGVWMGDAVHFVLPRSADSYGAAMLLQTPSAQYTVEMKNTVADTLAALESGEANVALLPADVAINLKSSDYHIHAVLTYTTLIAVSRETVLSVKALDGRTVTLSAAHQGSKAEKMLKKLLSDADASANIVYADDLAAAAKGDYDVIFADIDTLYSVLQADPQASACFSLSTQWRAQLTGEPPAGMCMVVRADYDASAGVSHLMFEKKLRDAVTYADEKRKKTVAMAYEAGLAASEAEANALIDYCTLRFLQDNDMDSAIAAWRAL